MNINMVIIFIVTLVTFLAVFYILARVRTPRYLMDKPKVVQLLQKVLVGQASENDWAIFLASSFRHSTELEVVRAVCAEIDDKEYLGHSRSGFLFTEKGLAAIRVLLDNLNK